MTFKTVFPIVILSVLLSTALYFSVTSPENALIPEPALMAEPAESGKTIAQAPSEALQAKIKVAAQTDKKPAILASPLMPLESYKRTFNSPLEISENEAESKKRKMKVYEQKQYAISWDAVSDELYDQRFLPAAYKGKTWMLYIESKRRIFVGMAADGMPMLLGEDEYGHRIATRYDKPIPLLPATKWELGTIKKTKKGTSNIRALSLRKGKGRDSGTVDYKISWVMEGKYRYDGKHYDAIKVTMERKLDLKLANSEVVVSTTYCPNLGMIDHQLKQKTKIMGLINQSQEERLILQKK